MNARAGAAARRKYPTDLLGGLVSLVVATYVGLSTGGYGAFVITLIAVFTIVGASHTLLLGAAGQASVGHAALLGAGAYAAVVVGRATPWGLPAELVAGLLVGLVIGLVIGLPSVRIGGLYLAIATLALSVVAQQVFYHWDSVTGGAPGIAVPPARVGGVALNQLGLLLCTLVVTGVVMLGARNILRGRVGRAWHALRTSPLAATAVGIPVGPYKVGAFAAAGAMVGVAGVLYGHAVNYIAPEIFGVDVSILTLVVAVVGGQRYLWGAALGAVFVQGLPELLRATSDLRFIAYGAAFVLVMLFLPEGFAGGLVALGRMARRRLRPAKASAALARPDEPAPLSPDRAPIEAAARTAPAARGGASLELADLTVSFGGVTAVADVSFTVLPGSIVGLVGPNGAGKSTLLNAVSGWVPAKGDILIDARSVQGRPASRRCAAGVGRTFQNVSLHTGLTVHEHVLIGQHALAGRGAVAQLLRTPGYLRAERRMAATARELLGELGLADVANERVETLPYGVQKRVDMARAIAAGGRLLLLDEPAAGLPPDEADALMDRVLALVRAGGTTVILVEHNVELVMRVCERVIALNFGRVIVDDIPVVARRDPDFVEAYLGA